MKLCVALDLPSKEQNLKLATDLKDLDVWLKVGFRSFIRDTKELISDLKSINQNFKIFLDLKLYDIPNTMADAAEEIASLGVDIFNIHASSGKEAMKMVVDRLKDTPNRPIILSVTALTSFDEMSFRSIYGASINEMARKFAKDSFEAGIDGVVCSAFESKEIKEVTDINFLTLTPGIRPFGESTEDQKRVANLDLAKEQLVDFIVVGRPIYQADNPKKIAKRILSNIEI